MQKVFNEKTFVICHNGDNVIHPSVVESGTCLSTGQPNVEEFSEAEPWKARLKELGYTGNIDMLDPSQPLSKETMIEKLGLKKDK